MKKRQHIRVSLTLPILCQPDDGASFGGVVSDLGLGGARVSSSEVPPPGTQLEITARLPGAPDLSRLPATVRWTDGRAFGVQFGLLGARDTHALTELMAEALRKRS